MKKQLIELLDTIIKYLSKLINATDEIAEQFQLGNEGKAIQLLKAYIEGIAWLVEAIETIQSLDQKYLSNILIRTLTEKLIEMEASLTNQDYVLFSDLLQYEMKEILIDYQREIEQFYGEMNNGK
ncbi:hypothetical protein [Tepidibacillus fermentans]|uniref:DUF8042 domain-containing protein n=1 Tax=Tepidibacillus fermentans TaxID=1281767 RepID=A0A4V6NZ02_9BACI|nr:hypothetical protein [Tepidibacillus fermentans]TCS83314.1 hypothetical protein EDD72_10554 [Tepidibacillus fermentans]